MRLPFVFRSLLRGYHSSSGGSQTPSGLREVAVAVGANQGDRYQNFTDALSLLEDRNCQVFRYSRLYETAPAYVQDQSAFLNAAVLLRTSLDPEALLSTLKDVETTMGRMLDAQRWGPRPIDLDIIFYHGQQYSSSSLQIPHPRWHERSFVLAPLADLLNQQELAAAAAAAAPASKPANAGKVGQHGFSAHDRCARCGEQLSGPGRAETTSQESTGLPGDVPIDMLSHSAPQTISNDLQQGLAQHQQEDLQQSSGHSSADLESCADSSISPSDDGAWSSDVTSEGLRHQLWRASQRWTAWQAGAAAGAAADGAIDQGQGAVDIQPVIPMRHETFWAWEGRSHVMGILNITPDSFSDGGQIGSVEQAVQQARQLVQDGADLLDVGGQSTRPGAQWLTPDEELERVLPVIRALVVDQERHAQRQILISVDTFHSKVAVAAIEAGADIVNDVSGGLLDPLMYAEVARLNVPYMMMHMRGTPSTMQQPQNTAYRDICANVASELNERIRDALAAGIKPWTMITDPGIGFAKSSQGNLKLIAGLSRVRRTLSAPLHNMPMLAGPSRKRFLRDIIGSNENSLGDQATAVAASYCVAQSANIVRAHNAKGARLALDVADAICSHR